MAGELNRAPLNGASGAGAGNGGWSRSLLSYWLVVAMLGAGLVWVYFGYAYRGDHLHGARFEYPPLARPPVVHVPADDRRTDAPQTDASQTDASQTDARQTDAPQERGSGCGAGRGAVADHAARETAAGIHFNVTTPANYRPDFAHPLLVVWAPSGMTEGLSERFTGLTGPATAAGFVVAHVRSVPLGEKALRALAEVPGAVAEEWCIDPARIAYTGHSDGGTVSNALAVLPGLALRPAAIAPSAMGMQAADMREFTCPAPLPVMVMHNRGDGHFPGYGVGVASWWASCNGCAAMRVASNHPDCEAFAGCAAPTLLCRAAGNHAHWPGFEHDLLRFLAAVPQASEQR